MSFEDTLLTRNIPRSWIYFCNKIRYRSIVNRKYDVIGNQKWSDLFYNFTFCILYISSNINSHVEIIKQTKNYLKMTFKNAIYYPTSETMTLNAKWIPSNVSNGCSANRVRVKSSLCYKVDMSTIVW